MILTAAALIAGYRYNRDWNMLLEQKLYDDPVVFTKTTRYQHLVMTRSRLLGEYRFYINGNLQFSSLDEERYHELLVHPAMSLVRDHKKILILGGGDGLALREALKYRDVREVLLVDLDPEMTGFCANDPTLRKLNHGAFDDARLTTIAGDGLTAGDSAPLFQETGELDGRTMLPATEKVATVRVMNIDADRFLSQVKGIWDVVFIDLPDPSTIELTKLYSDVFYKKVRRVLSSNGIIAVQATSPYHAKESFLCIKRTIEAAGLHALPYHENVPSFGDWGWFLAWKDGPSPEAIKRKAEGLVFNVSTRYLTPEGFRRALVFGKTLLHSENTDVNTLMFPVLLNYYLKESWLSD
jgi:spermidine synthase